MNFTRLYLKCDKPEEDSTQVQCIPEVSTSQTQYSSSCLTDESVQTEMSMKDKKNQVGNISKYYQKKHRPVTRVN